MRIDGSGNSCSSSHIRQHDLAASLATRRVTQRETGQQSGKQGALRENHGEYVASPGSYINPRANRIQ